MARGVYNLGFISDTDIYNHTKETVLQYKTIIDINDFNCNLIDPIKLTFDAKIYGKTFEEIIESEIVPYTAVPSEIIEFLTFAL